MKPKSLLAFALVVAALAAFIWFVERDLPSSDERGERAKKVLPIDAEDIDAVEIRIDGAVTRLERVEPATADDTSASEGEPATTAEWRLTKPMTARADADLVDDLVAGLTGLDKQRTLEEVDPAALGLAEPRATVTVSVAGQKRVLRVGEEVPASSNVIVDLDGGPEAHVVAAAFWSDLTRAPGDWRSRELFTAAREDVAEIRLRGDAEVVLRRDGDDFRIAEPFADEADKERVSELLAALSGLEASSFLDAPQDPVALGLAPAGAAVTVGVDGREDPVVIALGAATAEDEKTRYVEVDGRWFTAETDLAALTALAPAAWRSTGWSRLEVYEIDGLEARRGDTALRLERVDGDWRRDGAEIPYTAASDVLYAVLDAEVVELLDPSVTAMPGEPLYEITLVAAEGSEKLTVFPAAAGGHPAAREGRDVLFLLSTDSVDELVAKIEEALRAEPVPGAMPGDDAGLGAAPDAG